MMPEESPNGPEAWLADFRVSLACLTRLPGGSALQAGSLGPALWSAPLVGLLVAALTGLAYWVALGLGLPPFLAAALAVGLQLLMTGAFHEDGFADVADGFGGGGERERKLAILRDSRLGSYGAIALILLLFLRIGALAALSSSHLVFWALLAAGASGRAPLAAFLQWLPPARSDGLGAGAGRPGQARVLAALLLGLIALAAILIPVFGLGAAFWSLLGLLGLSLFWAMLSLRQIGGYTGDVLGALAATGELLVLLVAVSRL